MTTSRASVSVSTPQAASISRKLPRQQGAEQASRGGPHPAPTPDQARCLAQEHVGRVAADDDPAGGRAQARAVPSLGDVCDDYIASGHGRAASTERGYRRLTALYLGDRLSRPLDSITRRDGESLFRLPSERDGEMPANHGLSFLGSVYQQTALRGLPGTAQPGGAVGCSRRALPRNGTRTDIVSH